MSENEQQLFKKLIEELQEQDLKLEKVFGETNSTNKLEILELERILKRRNKIGQKCYQLGVYDRVKEALHLDNKFHYNF